MSRATAIRIYLLVLLLLALETLAAASAWALSTPVILMAAGGQFLLVLLFWLGLREQRGWVRLFSWLYLCWLLVMALFILGEHLTR